MTLSVKIMLLVAGIVVLSLSLHSWFLYKQINEGFTAQANQQMLLCTTLLQHRIDSLKTNLQQEMAQLSSSLFTENESILAAMLQSEPDFHTEVVHFAENLRKRTTLQYLTIVSADGIILSSSEQPAHFGAMDPFRDFPMNTAAYLQSDDKARLEWMQQASFGNRKLLLRGGYSLQPELDRFSFPGLQITVSKGSAAEPVTGGNNANPPMPSFRRTIGIRDYRDAPLLQVAFSYDARELLAQRSRILKNSIIVIVLSLLACIGIGSFLSHRINRPLAQLTDAALLMSVGQRDVRVPQDAGGEVGELLIAFNRMAEQLEEQQQKLLQAERVAAWQEIAQHLAHEIKNPLTPIRTSITNLRLSQEKAPEKFEEIFQESTKSILQEVEKLRRLADEFARFARLPAPELRTGNLNELIRECMILHRDQPGITMEFTAGEIPEFEFDSGQITEVLHNLLRNACEAMPAGGRVQVATSMDAAGPHRSILLTVQDSGEGMSEAVRKQIFTPYFTTKDTGTGLGLAIVQRIVTQHHGAIAVHSTATEGTRIQITFPLKA